MLTVLYKQQQQCSWQLHPKGYYITLQVKKCLCFFIQVFKAGQEMTEHLALLP